MSQNLDKVLSLLGRVKRSRKGWVARCPAHEDRHPSLSVGVGEDGRVLLHCYAGCEVEAVVAALGLQMADLYPDGRTTPPPTRATVQHPSANPHSSADSAVAGDGSGGSAEGTVARLQPDQGGCARAPSVARSRPTRRRSASRSISCVRLVSPMPSTWMCRPCGCRTWTATAMSRLSASVSHSMARTSSVGSGARSCACTGCRVCERPASSATWCWSRARVALRHSGTTSSLHLAFPGRPTGRTAATPSSSRGSAPSTS